MFFSVVSFSLLIHQNLQYILNQWGDSVQVSVYLEDQVSEGSLGRIKEFLTDSSYFKDIQYTSKDAAFRKFQIQSAESMPEFIFNKDFENPLPASFEMRVIGDLSSPVWMEKIKGFIGKLQAVDGVEDVAYGKGWIDNYTSFLQGFSYISGILIITLLAGSLFVTGNAIRSSMFQRQEEIEILELVGATSASIRKPYIVEGLFTGLLATVISLVICYLLFSWQAQLLQEHLNFWKVGSSLSFLNIPRILFILIVGLFFGGVGSWLCVSRINSGWAATRGANRPW